ncbi:hypothetical protein [Trueperella pyogenes]|uniref:hypothetical protein n=1 Tax=Trueperella pyogenes TaxID=1661 RepID=UPI00043AE991|nr:hypothetical protein [Trueperella pyogenes]AHU90579.1 hypothetical protein CQ11_08100 [Trueperella pyogenes]AWA43962.1 hypothetical protein DBV13_08075 [Trueperella pyogenes]OQD35514.1 hypothetical protein B1R42_08450 [Trueperella pyogenes]
MEYTATVDFVSAMDEDDLIDHFATHSGSLGEARDGYRTVFSVTAESFDDAVTSVTEIATAVGTVDALSVAPADLVDLDVRFGDPRLSCL